DANYQFDREVDMQHTCTDLLLDILMVALLRIRGLGNAGHAEACSIEADHIHNLPMLIRFFSWEKLLYYYHTERVAFLNRSKWNVDEFKPFWDKLQVLLRSRDSSEKVEETEREGER